jgi:uncharacterized delta-60 repeat protein
MVASALTSLGVLVLAGTAFGARAGTLDHSFGHGGKSYLKDVTGYPEAVGVGRQGRIVAAGFGGNQWADGDPFALARLRPKGELDRSFAQDGVQYTSFHARASADAISLGRRGGVVAAGVACADEQSCDLAVVRYKRDGKVDRSFGHHGKVRLDFGFYSSANAVERTAHHRILIAGSTCPENEGCDILLVRLNRDGTLDRSFGSGGKVIADYDSTRAPDSCGGASDMDRDSKGRIVVGGSCADDVALARFKPDGDLDRSFGNDGKVRRAMALEGASQLVIDSHDRIDVSGAVDRKRSARKRDGVSVARFRRGGGLDRSFGKRGRTGTISGVSTAMDLDSRGRIVLAGGSLFTFARFKSNGHRDHSFGHKGVATVGRHDWGYGYVLSMTADSKDRIIAAGFKRRHFTLVRVHG